MNTSLISKVLPALAAAVAVAGLAGLAQAQSTSSPLLVNQWLRQAEDGSIQGRVLLPQASGGAVAVSNAAVALTSADGPVLNAQTDQNGVFTFPEVDSGRYTLLARDAEDVCAIVALNVLRHDSAAVPLSSAAEISAGRVGMEAINSLLIRYLPPRPAELDDTDVNDVNLSFVSSSAPVADVYRVRQFEGGLRGQIYAENILNRELVPAQDSNVLLFQNGVEINRTLTDTTGQFQIGELQPGVYSVMVVGKAGFGLVGFELVGASDAAFAASTPAESTLVSAVQDGIPTQLVFQLTDYNGVVGQLNQLAPGEVVSDVLVDERVVGEEIVGGPLGGGYAGGGFGGGGFGGGGGGGGIGGIGGLAGLGLGAAAIAIAADNDDRVIIRPATPSAP